MRRLVLSVLVAALGLSGCAYKVNGTPVSAGVLDVDPPFSSAPPAPSTTGPTSGSGTPDARVGDVCKLLTWRDLPYDVRDKSAPPTETDYDPKFDQSCKWQTRVDQLDVGVTLRFREGRPISLDSSTGTFEVGGRTLTYFDRTTDTSVQPSCVLVMDYAGGGLGIIVIDGSARFGAICDQGKKVAQVMLEKEPTI